MSTCTFCWPLDLAPSLRACWMLCWTLGLATHTGLEEAECLLVYSWRGIPGFDRLNFFSGLPVWDHGRLETGTLPWPLNRKCTHAHQIIIESCMMEALPWPCGLRNLGNTCFLNAGVQCLVSSQYILECLPSGTVLYIILICTCSMYFSKP